MSVATKNPFAILEGAEDSTPSPAAPSSAATPAASNTRGRGSQQPRGANTRGARGGGQYYPRGGPGGGAPAQNRTAREGDEAANANSERPRRTYDGEDRRGRGRGGGFRGERGDRGSRGGGRGGARMDRHSATGKTDSDKKIHQTWGGDDGPAELKAEEAAVVDAAVAATDNTWGVEATPADDPWATPAAAPGDEAAPAPAAAEGEGRPARRGGDRDAREPEEEDNTVSYDQYLAQKAAEESALPKLAPRSANEGVDESQWKDAVEVTKPEEDAYFAPKAKSAPKQKAKKEEKVYIEIDARFERPRGGGDRGRGGDRGSRGGGRGRGDNGGGRGRGGGDRGPRGGRGPAGVDVADEKAFPSLS